MKIALDVKNTTKLIRPDVNNIVIYDGKEWCLVTKDDLLKENREMLEECRSELAKMKQEYDDLKVNVASQLLEMSQLLEKLYSKGE